MNALLVLPLYVFGVAGRPDWSHTGKSAGSSASPWKKAMANGAQDALAPENPHREGPPDGACQFK